MGMINELTILADQVMKERGLLFEFSQEVLTQANETNNPAPLSENYVDLRSLLWCSIDNDDSQDLDQLTYGEKKDKNKHTLWIAIADVTELISKGSPVDIHAQTNTTSVYTPGKIFTMIPEKFSYNLTSLNENEDRVAMVVKIEINENGEIESSSIFQAIVHNYAKLTYNSIGDWLEGKISLPEKVKKIDGLEKVLKTQNEAAQILRKRRHELGSLTLHSSEARVKIKSEDQITIKISPHNLAHQLIEEFMIATNQCMVQHFNDAKIASLRRVVRVPKNWPRIVEVANSFGEQLPEQPNSKALDEFLVKRLKADPDTFPDLSLTIIKLLGRGEYIVENDKDKPVGHFGLAVSNYTHSTAPNRRFPDVITQRQYKAFLRKEKAPYSLEELYHLAKFCTQQEDAATKVERQVNKSAAALVLSPRIGENFKGIITGINDQGIWVRIFEPAVEGKIVKTFEKLHVGDKVTVELKYVNVKKGFIDFICH